MLIESIHIVIVTIQDYNTEYCMWLLYCMVCVWCSLFTTQNLEEAIVTRIEFSMRVNAGVY